ncbi:hypothetical protein BDA99DRAFT_185822 [Phascolomyces articulosus]|uniref:FAD-binding domain-containing protein n=1 Tax=Phascolomyces articulosus TaxID=60185 RepID=A0AAD5PA51_9FUNG|nr:hypothetical protein BDA99DRAFT_185822 [Phascolomyces articulosus]
MHRKNQNIYKDTFFLIIIISFIHTLSNHTSITNKSKNLHQTTMVSTTADKKVDVLMSGAGPVGLFFALRMVFMNHTFKIIEKRQGACHETRAVAITARTLEVLHNRKLANCILKKAMTLQGTQMFSNGKKIAQINMSAYTIFPHISSLPQHDTEETFADLLGKDHISWNSKLIGYKQDSEGVEALVQNVLTGEEETIHARYIVGADGTHSAVRKLADDWSYECYTVGTKFVVGDAILEGKDSGQLCESRENGFFHPEGVVGMIPVEISEDGECYYRVFSNLGP